MQNIQHMQLKNPIMVGFGINDHATFTAACKYSNGAIIGSAYIKALSSSVDIETGTKNFLQNIIK